MLLTELRRFPATKIVFQTRFEPRTSEPRSTFETDFTATSDHSDRANTFIHFCQKVERRRRRQVSKKVLEKTKKFKWR